MTTRELLDQVKVALDNNVISLDDEVILIGTGNRKSGYLINVVVPTLTMNNENMVPSNDRLGSYHIGFTNTLEPSFHTLPY
jgi:hypothetical protein